jgi:NAD(P)-dependent dehydrogenase (short-subunit alcohol dehydrogenase family)
MNGSIDYAYMALISEIFLHFKNEYPCLDIIINNAAQTVRKPPQFYKHLIDSEKLLLLSNDSNDYNEIVYSFSEERHVKNSESLSQIPLIEGDHANASDSTVFPPGLYDIDDQQLDLRKVNSWVMKLGEISTVELIECHAINSFAPFILISELRGMMADPLNLNKPDGKYIVNVSAMEGQFYRHKTEFHPHTNMAKASLNMLTRTSSAEYSLCGIYMNSVDTGWITDEYPLGETKVKILF